MHALALDSTQGCGVGCADPVDNGEELTQEQWAQLLGLSRDNAAEELTGRGAPDNASGAASLKGAAFEELPYDDDVELPGVSKLLLKGPSPETQSRSSCTVLPAWGSSS